MNLFTLPIAFAAVALEAATDGKVALLKPEFSARGGIYRSNVDLRVTSSRGVVRYTLDGREPDETSPVFTNALMVTNCTTIRARIFVPGEYAGPIATESYTLLDEELHAFNSNLPLVILESVGGEFGDQKKVTLSMRCLRAASGRTSFESPVEYAGRAVSGIRGFSTRRLPKHSFSVKLLADDSDDKRKAAIFGMPKESDWVLYAPYADKTLMRDVIGYELSNAMGRYAPRTFLVEVFLNSGAARLRPEDYLGVYVFEERITRDKARVNIASLDPTAVGEPEVSGGYIFKKDHFGRSRADRIRSRDEDELNILPLEPETHHLFEPGGFPADPAGIAPPPVAAKGVRRPPRPQPSREQRPPAIHRVGDLWSGSDSGGRNLSDSEILPDVGGFTTRFEGAHLFFVHPEPDELTGMQRAWVKDYFDRFETALFGADFRDLARGYAAFIDPASFIDYHILTEATKNVDGFRFSTFYHKDREGRVCMGPLWDMNLTFGNATGKGGYLPEGWLWPQLNDQEYSWFRRLFEDPDFAQSYVDRWAELRTNVLLTARVLGRVDQLAASLQEAQARNFKRWPIMGEDIAPNYFVGTNYAHEVTWMKEWMAKRLSWIDAQFVRAPAATVTNDATMLAFTGPTPSEIFYTINGIDPRERGGAVAEAAKRYENPIRLNPGDRVWARRCVKNRWSAPFHFSCQRD
jgi:hypothetical protein